MTESNWTAKGAALSDKTARKEYGLTQEQIHAGIRAGKLQYRENHIHGNPYLRLLRNEVEALAKELLGDALLEQQKLLTELKSVESQIRSCNSKIKKLKAEKAKLQEELGQ